MLELEDMRTKYDRRFQMRFDFISSSLDISVQKMTVFCAVSLVCAELK